MQEESLIQSQKLSTEKPITEEFPKALIQWYPFKQGEKVLFLSGGEESFSVLPEAMEENGLLVDCIPFSALSTADIRSSSTFSSLCINSAYDYIILAGVLERASAPSALLSILYPLLSPAGKLLIGADNRFGIRYFCGDRDSFSGRNYDGIDNYFRLSDLDWKRSTGRAYAKGELIEMLEHAGFFHHRFYSVLPEWTRPRALYAEDCIPEGKPEEWIVPQYNSPDTIFLEEELLYPALIQSNLFHTMANGFFIECPVNGIFADAAQITLSSEYGREEATATIIRRDGQVEKQLLYRDTQKKNNKLTRLLENTKILQSRGLHMGECTIENGSLFMPYLEGEPAVEYFRRLICSNKEQFLQELERFFEEIIRSSDAVPYEQVDWEHFDPDWKKGRPDDPGRDKWRKIALGSEEKSEDRKRLGSKREPDSEREPEREGGKNALGIILKKGYINMNPRHCFLMDKKFVFYNQAYYQENFPANTLFIQTIDHIYWGDLWKKALITRDDLLERYHLTEHETLWHLYLWRFGEKLSHHKELEPYYRENYRDWRIVNANRYRMNYSENEYERVFKDIFKGTQGRQLYLFGSGIYAEKFLEEFGADYPVTGILDNNRDKWGTDLENIPIISPHSLLSLPEDSYKVLICIKNCVPIMRQLRELGVRNYSVYDCHQDYPRKLPEVSAVVKEEAQTPKKYHIGYIAGVFDLFHIGHLNMFRRAKEQCDYLIVGVVTDESVMNNKKTMPCMSFEERIELVRSCRYVDEAVELPTYNGDTDEAYRRYHFDVQFSGSDYADDPVWLAKKEYLEKRGAEMVFFPYTQTTSSTKIKEMIEKKLL